MPYSQPRVPLKESHAVACQDRGRLLGHQLRTRTATARPQLMARRAPLLQSLQESPPISLCAPPPKSLVAESVGHVPTRGVQDVPVRPYSQRAEVLRACLVAELLAGL